MSAPLDQPIVTCLICGEWEVVRPDGRGFPPDIAFRKLAKRCVKNGHVIDATYRAGIRFAGPVAGQSSPP